MRLRLTMIVDLGEVGTEAEHLADADSLTEAVAEVLRWRTAVKVFHGWSLEERPSADREPAWWFNHRYGTKHHGGQVEPQGVGL